MKDNYLKSIMGCLLGTAVGDALGLPYERLSRNTIHRSHTPIKGHAFILNKGMFSDDTEHICMTAQSLIVSGGDPAKFVRNFAWRLRLWLLGLPGGVGLATLKSSLKLWMGFSPKRSGVNSAGNGAAMRSTIIGVCYGADLPKLLALVKASTAITHNNHKAELGAIAVAVAGYLASIQPLTQPQEYYQTLEKFVTHSSAELPDTEVAAFLDLIQQACVSVEGNETAVAFANKLSNHKGVSGYIYHTVPVVIQVWLRNQDRYSHGVKEVIYLGGDTDTTAAILGGIIGSSVGVSGIPLVWLENIVDFPRNIKWIKSLSKRLAHACETKSPNSALPLAFYLIPFRNLLFIIVVLFHVFYRLLPF